MGDGSLLTPELLTGNSRTVPHAMAFEAERAHVRKIALSAALRHRDNVIGVPETLTLTGPPFGNCGHAGCAAKTLQALVLRDAVDAANRADAAIAFEDALAQVAGVAAQTPLFDAPF